MPRNPWMIDVLKDLLEAAQRSGKADTAEALQETVRIASKELAVTVREGVGLN